MIASFTILGGIILLVVCIPVLVVCMSVCNTRQQNRPRTLNSNRPHTLSRPARRVRVQPERATGAESPRPIIISTFTNTNIPPSIQHPPPLPGSCVTFDPPPPYELISPGLHRPSNSFITSPPVPPPSQTHDHNPPRYQPNNPPCTSALGAGGEGRSYLPPLEACGTQGTTCES